MSSVGNDTVSSVSSLSESESSDDDIPLKALKPSNETNSKVSESEKTPRVKNNIKKSEKADIDNCKARESLVVLEDLTCKQWSLGKKASLETSDCSKRWSDDSSGASSSDNKPISVSKNSKDTKVTKGDSRKLLNLKRYLNLCGVRIPNYKKLFQDRHSMVAKERKLQNMLKEIGLEGRPTIAKCKKIRVKREQVEEIAELDLTCIISGERQTRGARSKATTKTMHEKKRPKYDFGELSVSSGCSENEFHSDHQDKDSEKHLENKEQYLGKNERKKRKIIDSSSSSDDSEEVLDNISKKRKVVVTSDIEG